VRLGGGRSEHQEIFGHGRTRKYTEEKKTKRQLMATESTEGHGKIKAMSYIQVRCVHRKGNENSGASRLE